MDAIKDIIEHSGNNFQSQVIDFLREKGWSVLISPYYNDNITDKPREIDIIAEKSYDVIRPFFNRYLGKLYVQLFIECKYINKDVVFWLDKKDKQKAIQLLTNNTPLRPPEENVFINEHHYLKDEPVAKLFASNSERSQENELIYKAINQSLNALVYYKNANRIVLPDREDILDAIKYPLIVCNGFGNFYKIDKSTSNGYSKIDSNFQLEVNYAYLNESKVSRQEYFLIDVIDFTKFDGFLNELETKEINKIKSAVINELERQKDEIENNKRQQDE